MSPPFYSLNGSTCENKIAARKPQTNFSEMITILRGETFMMATSADKNKWKKSSCAC